VTWQRHQATTLAAWYVLARIDMMRRLLLMQRQQQQRQQDIFLKALRVSASLGALNISLVIHCVLRKLCCGIGQIVLSRAAKP
jgi:hypothetical protein